MLLNKCSTIWEFCRASNKRKLERLQERALRPAFNNKSDSYDVLLQLAELPSLANRRLQEIAILMFQQRGIYYRTYYVQEPFALKANRERRCYLRKSNFNRPRFNQVKYTIEYGKHSLKYLGPFLWSKLKKELRAEDSLNRFKTKIRKTGLTALVEDGCENCMLCNN